MYKLFYSKQARKVLYKMDRKIAAMIRQKMDEIVQNPEIPRADVFPLKGRPGCRLRVGSYRVLYKIEKEVLEIIVIKIASRGDVYK